ncbi:Ester hydrolase C11orf54 like protein [Cladophialophora carrionii]|uniref:Ester hydrolase C11orf54 like protein n=1 Tax=Cladophialophora carrionii TaxID=86049 RepID=A0A1C1CJB8_9EURO|nr:Ester hydrolase C11orf54 like protein [Cladophialophora carrionii]
MSSGSLPVKKVPLFPPSLSTLAESISAGLSSNFRHSSCTVSTPPDLTLPPYHLAAPGLTGSPRIVDIGGPPNLSPAPDLTKKYDLLSVAHQAEMSTSTGFMLGAGAGPFHVVGQNSELMPNFAYGTAAGGQDLRDVRNRTHYAKIKPDESVCCARIPNDSTAFALMCNLFCSDGLPGPCLHVTSKSRNGPLNFTQTIQGALKSSFGDRLISIGGVFLIKRGTAKLHVMPDFPSEPFKSRDDVDKWLRYFDMGFTDNEHGPLVCLTVLHSGDDDGLALRMEHTHCFTVSGSGDATVDGPAETTKGGHYHYDLDDTKEEIEYEGWFNVARYLYRLDQPGVRSG